MKKKTSQLDRGAPWTPKVSLDNIRKSEKAEDVEYEIRLLNQKRLIAKLRKDHVMIRRIDNACQFGQEKLSIILQLNQ